MVQIDNSQTIRMSLGDDVSFPLFVNVGSKLSPIRYEFKVGSEDLIYFYILYPNDLWEDALETLEFDCVEDNINENGDIIITIPSDITERLGEGKFEYQVRGLIEIDGEQKNVTITNPHEFWIVRDTDNDDEEVDTADKYFVYGELNYYIKNHYVEYSGENTDTAETIVNNNSKTIKVNVINAPVSHEPLIVNLIEVENNSPKLDKTYNEITSAIFSGRSVWLFDDTDLEYYGAMHYPLQYFGYHEIYGYMVYFRDTFISDTVDGELVMAGGAV